MAESLRAAIAAGAPLAGTVLTLPGAATAELLAEPFDLIWVDLEHAALSVRDAQEMILGAQAAGAFALVRLPASEPALLPPVLDAGADGIVLADVRDPELARAAVQRATHPPDGERGWGPRRLAFRGRGGGRELVAPSIWAQIESEEAVARAAQIGAVPGVDAICVGTADLSFSLGAPLDSASPQLREAIVASAAGARDAGCAFALAGALDQLPAELLSTSRILVHATGARLCAGAVDGAAEWLRSALESDQEKPVR
jgi:4-hydroxy-2-oxoheptanedioate aldolase